MRAGGRPCVGVHARMRTCIFAAWKLLDDQVVAYYHDQFDMCIPLCSLSFYVGHVNYLFIQKLYMRTHD